MRAALTLLLFLALAPAAHAAGSITVSEDFAADGNPKLSASASDGGTAFSWATCVNDTCTDTGHSGADFEPGDAPKGTVFQASAMVGGQATSAKSGAWGGKITATAPPSLSGDTKVGSSVTPQHATWTGGWSDDVSGLFVQVCQTSDGQGCRNTEPFCGGPPHGAAHTLTAADKYVQAVDYRIRGGRAYPQICQISGDGGAGMAAAQTVAVSPLVAVQGAGGTTPTPTPTPSPTVPDRPLSTLAVSGTPRVSKGVRATISCKQTCTVNAKLTLPVTRGGVKTLATAKAHGKGKLALSLKLSAKARRVLRRATKVHATLTVTVAGGRSSQSVTLKR